MVNFFGFVDRIAAFSSAFSASFRDYPFAEANDASLRKRVK